MALALPPLLCAAGVAMLRASWGRRKPALTGLGWGALVLGTIAAAVAGGAWGIATAWLAATLVAALLLAHAVATTPAGRVAGTRDTLTTDSWRFDASDFGRRMAVFLLVVPVGFAAAQLLAFGAQAAARRAGWAEADTMVLMLLGQPIAWTILASIQITRSGPIAMIAPAALFALAGAILWWPL